MEKERNKNKVLIITYYWPPAGGPGVQRWLKLANYLQNFGVETFVLTVEEDSATYPLKDETLRHEVAEGIQVYKTQSRELFSFYKKASGRKEVPFSGFANESDKPGPRQKLARFIRGNFFLPDARKGWNKYALPKALELLGKHSIDTVITTGPPHSTHLIGKKIKRHENVKWISDWRDPWTDIYYYRQFYPTLAARMYDLYLERSILEKADVVTTVSKNLKELLCSKSEKISADKLYVLSNGFDEKDFAGDFQISPDEGFTLSYTGTITKDYPLENLLKALVKLSADSATKKPVKLRLIGRRDEWTEKLLKRYAEQIIIEITGSKSHAEAIMEMRTANALLLVIPDIENNKGILTGKLFEYMASKRPIVGIGPQKGDAAEIMNETSSGRMFNYEDEGNLYRYLKDLYDGNIPCHPVNVQKYSRKSIAESLLGLLN